MGDYDHALNRALSHPIRLFIVTYLADGAWRDTAAIRAETDTAAQTLTGHLARLRAVGYIEARPGQPTHYWRITPLGCTRLTDHVTALEAMVTRVRRILADTTPTTPTQGRTP
ncbi:winged helix-turn-helix domain-containing protein [Amycolatopsis sp.]|uniref:winged helix-turn-helix domain-containing protein n=1 Tax=Amycolatopsis sp. TaxID=37632 RepID=UPI002635FCB3|nr:winged helix-turn-helix domain-containing protein [Amycolatopsis sp.]